LCLATAIQGTDLSAAKMSSVENLKAYINGPMGRFSTWFEGAFYVGSDEKFDYVVVSRRREADIFKTRRGELVLKSRMKRQKNQKNWVDITYMFSP